MRKRRRLANKLTIMVCAVLCAVSAFFYAPMEVEASNDSFSLNSSVGLFDFKGSINAYDIGYVDFSKNYNIDNSTLYEVDINFDVELLSDVPLRYLNLAFNSVDTGVKTLIYKDASSWGNDYVTEFDFLHSGKYYFYGSELRSVHMAFYGVFLSQVNGSANLSVNVVPSVLSIVPLFQADSSDYQNGYNAGYSDGESAGYGNGYSQGFADGEASVDTDSIYDEAFQAGKDSVDTQSYYDAGYQAGYDAAYTVGYESGYDVGYQSAMDRIENWGADTSDYPILVYNSTVSDITLMCEVNTNRPQVAYGDEFLAQLDFDVNPNHTYKIVFDSSVPSGEWVDFSGSQDEQINYNLGNFSVPWYFGRTFTFVQGANLSSNIRLECYIYASHFYDTDGNFDNSSFLPWGGASYEYFDYIKIYVYDYGPSGDTQNHIANQTDQLTNGYDDSKGNEVNSELSTGLNEYQTAEDSLWATATTGLKDFTFFDFESVPAMITGMSFITSIMGKWFNEAGGTSGVGIVLSILFSVMLVSMVLGLYRLYQSSSRRAEFRQIHKESMERWKRGK